MVFEQEGGTGGMKRKRWSSDEKTGIVMEWMTTHIGTAELCRKHKVSPTTL